MQHSIFSSFSSRLFAIGCLFALAAATACSSNTDGGGSGGSGGGGNNTGGNANTGGAGGSAATCESRVMAANDLVNAAIAANQSCTADSDCTLIFHETKCSGSCQVSVNMAGVSAVQMAVDNANAMYCDTFQQDGCPYATPSCALITAVCLNNKCDFIMP